MKLLVHFFSILFISITLQAAENFPPGWLPLSSLDNKPTWSEIREVKDRIQLYLPGFHDVLHRPQGVGQPPDCRRWFRTRSRKTHRLRPRAK
jgi:hypothetical protein